MDNDKIFLMTLDGKENIKNELNKLITETRVEITNRIQIARSFGDLSENSEYQSAKDEQAFVEGRIKELQRMLDNSKIIDSSKIDVDEVSLGKKVTFKELPDEEEETYEIVGAVEANPSKGKISNESPIAEALIGKHVNDEVKVTLPNSDVILVKIISVTSVN